MTLLLAACTDAEVAAPSTAVEDGPARFTVITPTLVRLEYADDGQFEDRPTQTVASRNFAPATFTSTVEGDERVIRTSALTLRYRRDSGAFSPENLSIELRRGTEMVLARPPWMPGANPGDGAGLGGWRRSVDNDADPQPLHDGLLSRAGWTLLNDSATVLLTATPPGFELRPARDGDYQDGYFFGYGLDYRQALADLRTLTGAAPLLPKKAFGVWFSRYWAYSEAEWRELVAQFRSHAVPLDTISVDTDWKIMHNAAGCVIFNTYLGARTEDPCSWNGWDWNLDLYPDPAGFVAWAHGEGLDVGLNIHPSISAVDPAYEQTVAATGPLEPDSAVPPCFLLSADYNPCYVFDWTQPAQLDAYFALHDPIAASGIDFWWLDWCCEGSSAVAAGLSADTWINAQYAAHTEALGSRWPAFSRIGSSFQEGKAGAANDGLGAFAEHRYTLHFTGDSCATWQMLAFTAELTPAEGSVGLPYVSHDVGSFLGEPDSVTGCNGTLSHEERLPEEMYIRWVQLGTFQPMLRLHSNHGLRLPWDYPGTAETIVTAFLRLRGQLVPFLYSLGRESHATGLPMARALYLQWPEHDAAYEHPTQFTLGDDLLVATVASPGNPASVEAWIPPGDWYDFFTGERHTGPASVSLEVPLDRLPVLVRAGGVLPLQPELPTSAHGAQDGLVMHAWPGADGAYELYEDAGRGFGYRQGEWRTTPIANAGDASCRRITLGAATGGDFAGQLDSRRWELRLHAVDAPAVVTLGGAPLASGGDPGWSYDPATRTVTVRTGPRSAGAATVVTAGGAGCS